MASLTLTINQQPHTVEVDPQMPLLWVIRDFVKLKGTKYGCGIGQCGACTVHLDGQAVRSCSIPAGSVGKAQITTIEGLSADGSHPLQQAWESCCVPQCGYCQAGQIMSAAALLRNIPNPTEADIIQGMNGNLCRCGTYLRVREAVALAASLSKKS